jgi:Amt family ammonium transporter
MSHTVAGFGTGPMIALLILTVLITGGIAWAQDKPTAPTPVASAPAAPADPVKELSTKIGDLKIAADTMWVLVTAFLVFFMNLGFATVESGFCRAKNTVTILAKNFIVFAVSSVAFLLLGFGVMFGDGNALFGTHGLSFVMGADNSPATGDAYKGVYSALNWTGVPLWAKFFFQLVFAGTAATIVSRAVAERVKFGAFYLFSFAMVGLIYPVVGHWIWAVAGSRSLACGTSLDRRLCTRWEAGRPWWARPCSGRGWASTARTDAFTRSQDTASRSER